MLILILLFWAIFLWTPCMFCRYHAVLYKEKRGVNLTDPKDQRYVWFVKQYTNTNTKYISYYLMINDHPDTCSGIDPFFVAREPSLPRDQLDNVQPRSHVGRQEDVQMENYHFPLYFTIYCKCIQVFVGMCHLSFVNRKGFYETFHVKVEVLLEVKGSYLTFGAIHICPL